MTNNHYVQYWGVFLQFFLSPLLSSFTFSCSSFFLSSVLLSFSLLVLPSLFKSSLCSPPFLSLIFSAHMRPAFLTVLFSSSYSSSSHGAPRLSEELGESVGDEEGGVDEAVHTVRYTSLGPCVQSAARSPNTDLPAHLIHFVDLCGGKGKICIDNQTTEIPWSRLVIPF